MPIKQKASFAKTKKHPVETIKKKKPMSIKKSKAAMGNKKKSY